MSYELRYTKQATKAMSRIPAQKAVAIEAGMAEVALNPFARDSSIKPLEGSKNAFRKRFGDYRVLYSVEQTVRIVEVYKVGTRGDVYK